MIEHPTDLGNYRLLGTSDEAKECTNHTEESEKSSSKGSTRLGLSLEGCDGVFLCRFDESEDLRADVGDGIFLERSRFLLLILRLGCLGRSFLEVLLDFESLSSK